MKQNPLISIVMPNFNGGLYIAQSIQTVLRQTVSNFELIVIDDGSTDNSKEIVAQIQKQDPRIILIENQKNQGVASARNKGIKYSNGTYIAFLDSDDLWVPCKLEKQLAVIAHADLCYTSYQRIDKNGLVIGSPYFVPPATDYFSLLSENVIGCSTVLFQKKSFIGEEMDARFAHEDYVFWLKALKNGKRFVGLPDPLMLYRSGGRSYDKRSAAKNRWTVYRKSEKLSFFQSCRFFTIYTLKGCLKHGSVRR